MFKESKGFPGYMQSEKFCSLKLHVDECQLHDNPEFLGYCRSNEISVRRYGSAGVLIIGTFPALLTMLADTFYYDDIDDIKGHVASIKEVK